MIGELPYSLNVNGIDYPINTDFRDAFDAFAAINADDLSPINKIFAMLDIIYGDNIPPDINEAAKQASWFLDGGDIVERNKPSIKNMDYNQDAPLIFSAVNKVAGREVREPEVDTHWWTFMGLCAEISPDSPISQIINIRNKMAKGKKLEKYEREFYNENKNLIDIKDVDNDLNETLLALREG